MKAIVYNGIKDVDVEKV
ncbi:MAG: hypothetical protein IJH34_09480, partial [Romboutsia sp.]|nr:hypothetical protein [Romboutsia sp.]